MFRNITISLVLPYVVGLAGAGFYLLSLGVSPAAFFISLFFCAVMLGAASVSSKERLMFKDGKKANIKQGITLIFAPVLLCWFLVKGDPELIQAKEDNAMVTMEHDKKIAKPSIK